MTKSFDIITGRLDHQNGGSMELPVQKTTGPTVTFCNEICSIYVRAIKNHNSCNNLYENVVPFQNGGQIIDY